MENLIETVTPIPRIFDAKKIMIVYNRKTSQNETNDPNNISVYGEIIR